ncbi:hypothetical protein J437_LFUL002847 [Ladona fulva]|uniref:Cytochrome P450 n=1 Tax=Ladona fulva TaxID=123851 RepID=A0A8K0K1W1_LADFU|nr:hypothetical protein J437_LFUL002847 [Ladona fulva]
MRDPEIIKQVMVRDFDHFMDRPTLNIQRQEPYVAGLLLNLKGQVWKQVRSLMTPAFTSGRIKGMYAMVDKVALQLVDYLDEKKKLNEKMSVLEGELANEFEMKDLFGRFTFDVIASCAFGVTCDSLLNPNAEFVKVVSKFDYISVPMRLLIFCVIMGNHWITRFVAIRFLDPTALAFLVELLKRTKKEREEAKGTQRNDFLQLMIDAQAIQNVDGKESAASSGDSKPSPQQVLTDDVVISQCLLFLLAGYETSSTLLTFAAYELALNPDIQEKARNEINSVLNHHKNLTYESLNEMPYLEMVLLEALRKHPPVARIDRDCVKDYNLLIPATENEPERHILIEKGTPVSISVMGLHYDPKYFPEPDRFNPERFSAEEKAKRPSYVFQGFGHGPRNCLGMRFALMSTKLAMARLLMGHKLECSPRTQVPYTYNKFAMLLKAKDGIWLRVIKMDSS